MAALTPLTWHAITLAAIASPPYTVPNEQMPGAIMDLVVSASTFYVFCTSADATYSVFVALDYPSVEVRVRNAAISIASTPAMDTSVLDSGETLYSVRDTGASWSFYSDQSGSIRRLAVSATLGAFIS